MSEIERKSLEKSLEKTVQKVRRILFWAAVVLTIFALFYQVAFYYRHYLEEKQVGLPGGYNPTYNAVKTDEFVFVGILLIALFFVILATILQNSLDKLK